MLWLVGGIGERRSRRQRPSIHPSIHPSTHQPSPLNVEGNKTDEAHTLPTYTNQANHTRSRQQQHPSTQAKQTTLDYDSSPQHPAAAPSTYVAGLTTSASSTVAGPTSQAKKRGVIWALNSQARREEPGKSARKIWLKPCGCWGGWVGLETSWCYGRGPTRTRRGPTTPIHPPPPQKKKKLTRTTHREGDGPEHAQHRVLGDLGPALLEEHGEADVLVVGDGEPGELRARHLCVCGLGGGLGIWAGGVDGLIYA